MSRWNRPGFTAWFTIAEIAGLVGDTEENIQSFIREDRIPYLVHTDGILIWLYGFQECMNDLYDLEGFLIPYIIEANPRGIQLFERFTERARQVVILAQESARATKCGYIGAEHILLGIVREEESLAAKVLKQFDMTPDTVTDSVVGRLGGQETEVEGQIPFTPRVRETLERALREALSLGHNYIGTEHILLALVRNGENTAVEIMRDDFDLTPTKVRDEVMRILQGPKPRVHQESKSGALEKLKAAHAENEARSKYDDQVLRNAIVIARQLPTMDATAVIKLAKSLVRDDV